MLILAEAIWAIAEEDSAVLENRTATLALMLGMILAGVAVLQARRWGGWHRYTVLTTGPFIPLILMPAFALPGHAPNRAIGIWGVCWLLVVPALWRRRPATGAPAEHGTEHRQHGRS